MGLNVAAPIPMHLILVKKASWAFNLIIPEKKMSKKAREKPAEAGSASVSPYGSVLGYELVTSQPNRLINLIWPECRTWFIGPWIGARPYNNDRGV